MGKLLHWMDALTIIHSALLLRKYDASTQTIMIEVNLLMYKGSSHLTRGGDATGCKIFFFFAEIFCHLCVYWSPNGFKNTDSGLALHGFPVKTLMNVCIFLGSV